MAKVGLQEPYFFKFGGGCQNMGENSKTILVAS